MEENQAEPNMHAKIAMQGESDAISWTINLVLIARRLKRRVNSSTRSEAGKHKPSGRGHRAIEQDTNAAVLTQTQMASRQSS